MTVSTVVDIIETLAEGGKSEVVSGYRLGNDFRLPEYTAEYLLQCAISLSQDGTQDYGASA